MVREPFAWLASHTFCFLLHILALDPAVSSMHSQKKNKHIKQDNKMKIALLFAKGIFDPSPQDSRLSLSNHNYPGE